MIGVKSTERCLSICGWFAVRICARCCRGARWIHRAVAINGQIASALEAAHAEGLVHRDVKPENIIITPADFAYLVDFGIAEADGDTRLTSTGSAIGSFAYMAPERFTGQPATPAADIYALACVLHETLTGTAPYPGNSLQHVIADHVSKPPPRPSAVNSLFLRIRRGHRAGHGQEPDDRYGSAAAFGRAAQRALQPREMYPTRTPLCQPIRFRPDQGADLPAAVRKSSLGTKPAASPAGSG
jgi:serine/threonine-protein kinase